jgi:hypothetical protein
MLENYKVNPINEFNGTKFCQISKTAVTAGLIYTFMNDVRIS